MYKRAVLFSCAFLFVFAPLPAQQQPSQPTEESAYGSRFFDQLRTIFGRFRNSDLQRVFQEAQPVQCSELIGRKGEWRPVAFFNEDRKLGDWCRDSLEEVKADLSVYTFQGVCRGERGTVRVTTEFPTAESIESYRQRRIDLDEVDITVNDPVDAVMNTRTMAYTFDLPYLFLSELNPRRVYSFSAPDRKSAYANEVSSHWECKAVSSRDVTYRFLICRVATVPRKALKRGETWEPSFGSSAFFILSDGTEARASVNLTFGDPAQPSDQPEKSAEPEPSTSTPVVRPTLRRPN